jgi:hypothetical protein
MPSKRAKIDNYITRSFRDVADDDYVSARALYLIGQDLQFLVAAQQAIEKYLKAILAYDDIPGRDLGHNIVLAFERIKSTLHIEVPTSVDVFVHRLGQQGLNRYFEIPINTQGLGLLELDEAVSYLRRHCRPLSGRTEASIDGRLEEILASKSRAREELIWKNRFLPRRRTIRFARRVKWANPTNFLYPEVFPDLDRLIRFSEPVRKYFLAKSAGKVLTHGQSVKTIKYTTPEETK